MSHSIPNAILAKVRICISFLLELIETQDWIKFEDIFLLDPNMFRVISQSISDCKELSGMTLLHACVRSDPPLSVLHEMIKIYPRALRGEDCLGRTPLHVAAGSGASSHVMKLLTENYPEACIIQDDDGRTPLHYACDTSCELFDDGYTSRCPPCLDTVRVLLSGSIDAVTLEDVDETTAVEYAIISDAPMDVINILQRSSQMVMKKVMMTNKSFLRPCMTSSPFQEYK